MAALGYVFLGLIGVGAVGALVAAGMSASDIKRYMKMRKM